MLKKSLKLNLFYIILSLVILILGQAAIFLHILHTPGGYYYPYLDQIAPSDYYYIAMVRQGMSDSWLTKIPYVIKEHQATIIQIPFIWLGKASKITGIGPAEVLAIARVLGGIVFLYGAVKIFKSLLPEKLSKAAFVIFLLTQPLPSFLTSIFSESYSHWVWHFGEAARRISIMPPHYTSGKGLALVSLFYLFSYLKNPQNYKLGLIFLTAILSGIIYPPPNFVIIFSLVLAFAVFAIINSLKIKQIKFTQLVGFGIFILSTLIPIIILKLELNKGYPWNMWNRVELGWNDPAMHFEWGYFRMMWLLFLFVPVFAIYILKSGKEKFINTFLLIWGISAFILFPFADLLNLGKFRFTEGVQIVPLAIMAAEVTRLMRRRILQIFYLLFLLYFLLFAGLTRKEEILRFWPIWENVYFQEDEIKALEYLEKNADKGSIVLANYFASNYIPDFANVRSPLGFSDFYPDYADYKNDLDTAMLVMSNKLTPEEAEKFFKQKQAEYLYVDKLVSGDLRLYPEILSEVFNNKKIRIYRINQNRQ